MRSLKTPEGGTPFDASGLIPAGIRTYQDLNAAEIRNILKAVHKHLRRRKGPNRPWFTEAFIRSLYRDMFDEGCDQAGHYRETAFYIGVQPYLIRHEIPQLC